MSAPLRVSVLACTASMAALAATALGLSHPEGMIERSYAQAFDRLEAPRNSRGAQAAAFDPAHLHLSRLPAAGHPGPAMAVGDRITLVQRTGGTAAYEVIDVRPLPAATLGETGAGLPRLMLITAVTSGQLPALTIRFIIDADAPAELPPAPMPRAL